MEIRGSHSFAASPQAVWDALHNSAALQSAIPGAEEVAWQGESAIAIRAHVGIGPIGGTYSGTVQVVEQSAPTHLKLAVTRASVQATATLDLAPNGSGTQMTYVANATLAGALAVADNPLARGVIDQQLNQFFSRLEQQIR